MELRSYQIFLLFSSWLLLDLCSWKEHLLNHTNNIEIKSYLLWMQLLGQPELHWTASFLWELKKPLQTIVSSRQVSFSVWSSQKVPLVYRCFLRIGIPAFLEGTLDLLMTSESSELRSRIAKALATALLN